VPHVKSREPCGFTKVLDGPQAYTLNNLRLQKKEPRCLCLSEVKVSQSQRMWAEVSSFTPHPLHSGVSSSPSRWRCLLRVLCPVRRPVTALDWVLLKDRNLALAPRLGPEINSRACLGVLPKSLQLAQCRLINQRLSLFCISLLETPRAGSGPNIPEQSHPLRAHRRLHCLVLRHVQGPKKSHHISGRDVIQRLLALLVQKRSSDGLSAFSAAWLSEHILTYFSGLFWNWIL